MSSAFWKVLKSVGLYSASKNEVETNRLFLDSLERGISVYFPRVEQGIRFYEVSDPEELQKGAWGIMEPKHSCPPLPGDQSLDLLLVPGVAFDQSGYRLGYGKAFYDQVLALYYPNTIGLAYEFQLVHELPVEKWDRTVSRVVTEKKVYEFKHVRKED